MRFRFSPEHGVMEALAPKDVKNATTEPPTERPRKEGAPRPPAEDAAPGHDAPARMEESLDTGKEEDKGGDALEAATRAYANEASRLDRESDAGERRSTGKTASGDGGEIPWETAPGEAGWLVALLQTIVRVMFATPRFFGALKADMSQRRALAFYVIICAIQTGVERLWSGALQTALDPDPASDPHLTELLGFASQTSLPMWILLSTALLIVRLYFFCSLMHLVYHFVAPQKASFAHVFLVMAYSAAPGVLCIIPGVGSLAGMVWSVFCLVTGLKRSLGLDWIQTLLGFVPLCLLIAWGVRQMLIFSA